MSVRLVSVGMADQLDFFAEPPPLPPGFKFQRDVLSAAAEQTLVSDLRALPFREFEFHGFLGRRRTVSFGWSYDFGEQRLNQADDLPPFLLQLREVAAQFAGLAPDALQQVLVTEYAAGASIGWHRDKAVFAEVIGISLLSACKFRLRRPVGGKWERVTVDAEPRSIYLLSGPARSEWEHSIPAVDALRYSITFRRLAPPWGGASKP